MSAPSYPEIELALTAAALSGDAGSLYRLATRLMDGGVPFDSLLFDYLIPAERELGRRWQQGDYLVADEHAATAAVETLISLLAGMLDQPSDGTQVVVATAEGDQHSLPGRATAAYLLFLGYRTTFLGANVPGAGLRDFLEPDPPAALVLSCAMTSNLVGAHSVIAAAHDVNVPVVVGGAAFGPDGRWARAVGADAWVGSPREVPPVVDRWSAPGGTSIGDEVALPDDLADLTARRSVVIADTEASLIAGGQELVDRFLHDSVVMLLGAVEASVLVADPQPAVEMLQWLESTGSAHGSDGGRVARALLESLETSGGGPHAILEDAIGSVSGN